MNYTINSTSPYAIEYTDITFDPALLDLIIEQNLTIIEQNNELIKYLRTLAYRTDPKH